MINSLFLFLLHFSISLNTKDYFFLKSSLDTDKILFGNEPMGYNNSLCLAGTLKGLWFD